MRDKGTGTEDQSLLSSVLLLYHRLGETQKSIAAYLGVSVATVNRLLADAKEQRLVRTNITLPKQHELAGRLRLLFSKAVPKPRAIVIPVRRIGGQNLAALAVGNEAAKYFEGVVRHGDTVAIDGGQFVAYTIEALHKVYRNITLYPIAGGPPHNPYTSIQALIGRFLGRYGTDSGLTPHFLPPPTENIIAELARDRRTSETLAAAADSNVFLLGVGSISPDHVSDTAHMLLETLGIDFETLVRRGIVGVSGYSTFDESGNVVESDFDKKVFKVSGDQIRKAARSEGKHVILVSCGKEKARAIGAMLNGGWVNCIVTDQTTADEILKLTTKVLGRTRRI